MRTGEEQKTNRENRWLVPYTLCTGEVGRALVWAIDAEDAITAAWYCVRRHSGLKVKREEFGKPVWRSED